MATQKQIELARSLGVKGAIEQLSSAALSVYINKAIKERREEDKRRLEAIDVEDLKSIITKVSGTTFKGRRAACPLHGGKEPSFSVFATQNGAGWRCHSQCQESGNAVAFVKAYEGGDWGEAYKKVFQALGEDSYYTEERIRAKSATFLEEPPTLWREKAGAFVKACKSALWTDVGRFALGYLMHERKLSKETIWDADIGFSPYARTASRESWGLELDGDRQMYAWGNAITIPWYVDGQVWRVRFRLEKPDSKGMRYRQLAGSGNPLYGVDHLPAPGSSLTVDGQKVPFTAIMTEGEIDALSIEQAMKDEPVALIPVACGGTGGARRVRWIARLAMCDKVLIALDSDEAGEKASKYWLDCLPNAIRWKTPWGDANDMLRFQTPEEDSLIKTWIRPALSKRQPKGLTIEELFEGATKLAARQHGKGGTELYLKAETAYMQGDRALLKLIIGELRANESPNDAWGELLGLAHVSQGAPLTERNALFL